MSKRKEGLTAREKIAVLGVMILGREYLPEAFAMSHQINTKSEDSLAVMRSRWYASQLCKDFRKEMTDRLSGVVIETMENCDLSDDQLLSIIQRGIVTQRDSKDASNIAFKLMEWRKKAQTDMIIGEERRRYFIPYISDCKRCKLMELYKEVLKEKKPS